jgi:Xaa-Pro aminopeptidase
MHWLETQMAKGAIVTEMTAADELERIQKEDPLFKMLSFDSISAVGPNAAVVHYSTIEGKNVTLTKDKIYLLDAGAQYLYFKIPNLVSKSFNLILF